MLLINDLSDDCLRMIFARLPLSSKLTLHRICPRWRSLQYSVTCNHKSLTLLIGTGSDSRRLLAKSCLKIPYINEIEQHNFLFSERTTLELTNLSRNVVSQLIQLLPKIESLELCLNQCEVSSMNWVLDLLRFWSRRLKYLSLYYNSTGARNRTRSLNVMLLHFQLLNVHCLALDYLSIELRGDFYLLSKTLDPITRRLIEGPATVQLDLSCLGRLKEFRFFSPDPVRVLWNSLKNYANTESLKKIAIGNAALNGNYILSKMPQIVPKLTLIRGFQSPSEYSKFTSLTSLMMSMNSRSWTQFTTYLAPLKNLIHVRLRLHKDVLSEYDLTPSYELTQLPSIRIIQIHLTVSTYCELQSRHWGYIFPSVQLLELKLSNSGETPTQEVKAARLNLLLEPFKWQCGTLRRIVTLDTYFNDDNGSRNTEKTVWKLVEGNNWNQVERTE